MKVTTQETLYHEDHGATLKHKCGKRIVELPLFISFFWAFIFLFGLSLFLLGKCSIKWWSSHFYLCTTQWLQLDTRTKYDSIWMPPAVYRDVQWIKSDMHEKLCMVAYPQIRCQLHDHAWQYDNMKCVIWTELWKVAWKYISEWLWNAMIGRYGGCFEEDIWWLFWGRYKVGVWYQRKLHGTREASNSRTVKECV